MKTTRGRLSCSPHTATVWASGRTRNPCFLILGALLLFDKRVLMLLPHGGYGMFGVSPNFTHFHPFSGMRKCCDSLCGTAWEGVLDEHSG